MMSSSLFGVRRSLVRALGKQLVHLRQTPPCPTVWVNRTLQWRRSDAGPQSGRHTMFLVLPSPFPSAIRQLPL